MPYRRLPKTDVARVKALKVVLENSDMYTVTDRFINWDTINAAQSVYQKLTTAMDQYKRNLEAQKRHTPRIEKLQRNASMYVSHFLQVLFMSVDRGEIKKSQLELYGISDSASRLPDLKTVPAILEWGKKTIEGEKERLKHGGRPIYNPTIGMVSTHYDIYADVIKEQNFLVGQVDNAVENLRKIRPEVDEVLLDMWNQIEAHFADLPVERRFNECRKYGVVYYYRRHEEHLY